MQKGLVSIITPCYNGEKYVRETIESVINQTYQEWEMIIIDDGSKDNSVSIISEYVAKDGRIRLVQQPNRGSASARNNGIKQAKGQYIALLDADDLWDAIFLEEQIKFLQECNAVCVCCSYRKINGNSQNILQPTIAKKKITYDDMMVRNYVGCLTGLYDVTRHGKIFLHEELKSIRDDYAYWLDIAKLENLICGNGKILASYRVLPNSTTGRKTALVKKQYLFYRTYLCLGIVKSVINTLRWGVAGYRNFY